MNSGALAVIDSTADEALTIAELRGTIERQQREIELLNQKLQYLLHQRFGRKSEQTDSRQGSLFDTAEVEPEAEEPRSRPNRLPAAKGDAVGRRRTCRGCGSSTT